MLKSISRILLINLLILSSAAFALDTAKLKFDISGVNADNRYFLCFTDIGCLSILASDQGRLYQYVYTLHPYDIYLTDLQVNHAFNQNIPASCNVDVPVNHTLTIHGHISNDHIGGLYCQLS